jgi:NAD(P)-dependent dehydrogenase (short-subunit alcohol dehydrogenase family)
MFSLKGKRVALVGAAGGIGRELAAGLAHHGAHVLCLDRDVEGGLAAAAAAGPTAEFRVLDVLDDAQVDDVARGAQDVDALVFTTAMNVRKRLLDLAVADFDRVVALNLRASFALIQAFGRGMVARGSGSIVGFSSIRAQTVEPGQGGFKILRDLFWRSASELYRLCELTNLLRLYVIYRNSCFRKIPV